MNEAHIIRTEGSKMSKSAKIKRIAELRKQMEKDFYSGNWDRYNEACDKIGELNRSMMR